ADFAVKVASSFSRAGSTLHLNSTNIKNLPPVGAPINAWLDEQEQKFQYIVYEADPEPSEWTNLCIRQADRILLVADGEKQPAFGNTETQIQKLCSSKTTARKELVLFHQDGTVRPRDSQVWVKTLGPEDRHHHLRINSAPDFDRLTRILTGNAIGLVLGG